MRRTISKLAVIATLALATVSAVALGTASPASAAVNDTYTTYCFRHPNGAAWTNYPVYAQMYVNGQWVQIGQSTSNINGCGAFWMPANRYVRVMAYLRLGNAVFRGYTNWGLTPYYGYGTLNLGTGIVYT